MGQLHLDNDSSFELSYHQEMLESGESFPQETKVNESADSLVPIPLFVLMVEDDKDGNGGGRSKSENDEEEGVTQEGLEESVDWRLQQKHQWARTVMMMMKPKSHWPVEILATITAAFMTYTLINKGEQMHPQIATLTVLVWAGAFCGSSYGSYYFDYSPHLVTAAGVGTFVGCCDLPNGWWFCLLSVVAAVVWQGVKYTRFLVGWSGRLGSTAFVATNITLFLWLVPAGAFPLTRYGSLDRLWGDVWDWKWKEAYGASSMHVALFQRLQPAFAYAVSVTVMAGLGGFARLHLERCCFSDPPPKREGENNNRNRNNPNNAVMVPVTLALFFMITLNATEYRHRSVCYDGLAVGSYVAMASFHNLPSVRAFSMAGILAALWGVFIGPFFVGFGGKAGFTATLGYATFRLGSNFIHWLKMLFFVST